MPILDAFRHERIFTVDREIPFPDFFKRRVKSDDFYVIGTSSSKSPVEEYAILARGDYFVRSFVTGGGNFKTIHLQHLLSADMLMKAADE